MTPTTPTTSTTSRARRAACWLTREIDPGELAGIAAAVLAGLLTAVLRGDTSAGLLVAVAVVGGFALACLAHGAAVARLGLDRCEACGHADGDPTDDDSDDVEGVETR